MTIRHPCTVCDVINRIRSWRLTTRIIVMRFYLHAYRNEFNPIFTCWEIVLWLRLWKKSLLYIVFSMVFFLWPHGLWLSNVAGLLWFITWCITHFNTIIPIKIVIISLLFYGRYLVSCNFSIVSTGALLLWLSFLYIVMTFKDLVQKRSDFVIVPKGHASTSYDQ